MKAFYLRTYLVGYAQLLAPRWLRALLAGTTTHRAWLAGYTGIYQEGACELWKGVMDRSWYAYRKGPNAPQPTSLIRILLDMRSR